MQRVLDPWMLHFLRDDPTKDLSTMKCPAFALFGEKDLQVAPSQNTEKMRQLLKNPKSEVKIYPKLNHLFQHCETGNPNRYAEIEETISAEVLRDIINFIQAK
jgi:fermentation-respiration switch protein FrsA (DUF1100 family)